MERKEENKLPEFQSLEEEKEYWEARGPLAEGRKGRINKSRPNQKRSSFLSVRLTGEEITALREVAAIFYTRPSEFARGAILDAVKRLKSLHEREQKEQESLEEALSYELHLRHKTQTKDFKSENSAFLGNELTINFVTHEVFRSGKQVNLTPIEYYLLFQLVIQMGNQKERESFEEAFRYGLSYPSMKQLDLRSGTPEQGFESEQFASLGSELTINFATHEVFRSGKQVNWTPTEYYLLSELIRRESLNMLFPHERITK